MERSVLFSLAVAVATMVNAQLAPQQDAPLKEHLLEVNACWRTMDPTVLGGERVVHFKNEAERIATHLHMVRERLAAVNRTTDPATAQERAQLLAALDVYADRGTFPQNNVLPVRNPVFIDPVGTACAVGQLMIESGHNDLALRIHDEMNLAYVHDMKRSDVDAWAVQHGFTEDELAWIQPGYPPPTGWVGLGGGTNGPVNVMKRLSDTELLVAGSFTNAGGVSVMNVARWDGATFYPYGSGVSGEIDAVEVYNGAIYLGGVFNNGQNDLAKWNGSTWEYSTVFAGKTCHISALAVHYGSLYAAGEMNGFAGLTCAVQRLDGVYWVPAGMELNGVIRTLYSLGDYLICGGDFLGHGPSFNPTDTSLMHVAILDGPDWGPMGNGVNASVHTFAQFNGDLYAGGDMFINLAPMFGLAKYNMGTWEPQMPNMTLYAAPWNGPAYINSMVEYDNTLYFGGSFSLFVGLVSGAQIGAFNGTPDGVEPFAYLDQPAHALSMLGIQLIAGGAFESDQGGEVLHLAATDITTDVPDHDANTSFHVWPNPTADQLIVDLTSAELSNAIVEVIDATGRVQATAIAVQNARVDVAHLTPGAYVLRVNNKGLVRSASFVKR